MTVQFFDISIDITVELSTHLYITLCSKINTKVNEHLIQTFLNAESEINMMNHKVVETCNISIYCEVTFKMKIVNSGQVPFYSCVKNVKMNVINITFTLFIFVIKEVKNELILKHLWEQVIEINTFS